MPIFVIRNTLGVDEQCPSLEAIENGFAALYICGPLSTCFLSIRSQFGKKRIYFNQLLLLDFVINKLNFREKKVQEQN